MNNQIFISETNIFKVLQLLQSVVIQIIILFVRNHPKLMAEKKIILKQFEWFEVQTKVRQIIGQVLNPMEKKLTTNTSSIMKLQQKLHSEQSKLNQITLMVHNDPQIFDHGIFANIQNKFRDQQILINQLSNKINFFQQFIGQKTDLIDRRMAQSTQILHNLNDYKEFIKCEIDSLNNKLIHSQQNVFNSLTQTNQDISQLSMKMNTLKTEYEIKKSQINNQEKDIHETEHRLDEKLGTMNQVLKQMKMTENIHTNNISQLLQQVKRLDYFEVRGKKIQQAISDFDANLKNQQYKLEVLQPMISLTQTNEYLHHILPQKYHKNASIYYYNRYNQLAEEILNSQFKNERVGQSIKGNLNLIKEVNKRSIKLVFKLKKEELKRRGIDIDQLSHQKKQEYLTNLKIQQSFPDLEGQIEENIKMERKNDEAINLKMKEEFIKMQKELKDKINLQINDSKNYIIQMQFLIKKEQQKLQDSIKSLQNETKKFEVNYFLENQINNDTMKKALRKLRYIESQQHKCNSALKEMHNIMIAFNEIQKQDEKDRLEIALLGVREHFKDDIKDINKWVSPRNSTRKVLNLDDNCLSCSGNPNYYNQFFKMACLTYRSSPIQFGNNVFERIDLIDKIHQQLSSVHHKISQNESIQKQQLNQEKPLGGIQAISTQIMSAPSKQNPNTNENIPLRNISTSQQMRPLSLDKSADARIIHASELSLARDLMHRTRTRLFSRKTAQSYRNSSSKKQQSNKERSQYMVHVSRYFKDLKKKNEDFIH